MLTDVWKWHAMRWIETDPRLRMDPERHHVSDPGGESISVVLGLAHRVGAEAPDSASGLQDGTRVHPRGSRGPAFLHTGVSVGTDTDEEVAVLIDGKALRAVVEGAG